jgi:hypothetical protein
VPSLSEGAVISGCMNQVAEKEARERDIFNGFIAVTGLPVASESIRSRPPPEPDILCDVAGEGLVAFELVELIDEDLARHTARRESNGIWYGDPTLDTLRKKLMKKRYRTQHPMELVAYGDGTLLPHDSWLDAFEDRLRNLLDRSASFRRLWVVNLSSRASSPAIWLVYRPDSVPTDPLCASPWTRRAGSGELV